MIQGGNRALEGLERCIDETKSGSDGDDIEIYRYFSGTLLWKASENSMGLRSKALKTEDRRRSKVLEMLCPELGSNGGADIAATLGTLAKERHENPIDILIKFLIMEKGRYQPSTDYVS
ncbi:hypothetical protein TELCIR_07600 [Teladorsagia circumcincta]|uniref:Uncharacterized protein n=1 Tax=Teladorsagia circumcincta TaxID=45464 RepID=A0A2G9UJW7_TELCI|nr:hypothetical protein TELCIR_07600 [Teladorsagia circumcincta]